MANYQLVVISVRCSIGVISALVETCGGGGGDSLARFLSRTRRVTVASFAAFAPAIFVD